MVEPANFKSAGKYRIGAGTPDPVGMGVTASEARTLRTLAEESREFEPRLEHTALVLYDRDPEHLQAQ